MLFHINILSTPLNIKTDLEVYEESTCRLRRINVAAPQSVKAKWQYTGHTISSIVNSLLESLKKTFKMQFLKFCFI